MQSDSEEIVGYTENILKYIETVKTKTGMEIAFQIRAHDFMDYHEKYHGPCKCCFFKINFFRNVRTSRIIGSRRSIVN